MRKRMGHSDPDVMGWVCLGVIAGAFLLALLLFSGRSYGGWGPRGCSPVGGSAFAPDMTSQAVTPLTWHYDSDWENTGGASLYRGNVLIATYNYNTGLYAPADGSVAYHPEGWPQWRAEVAKDGCKCKKCDGKCKCGKGKCCGDKGCKCCCPSDESLVLEQIEQNFGLELDKIGTSGSPRYSLCDDQGCRLISKDQASKALTKGGLSDDSDKPFIVVVCKDPKQRVKIHEDILADPSFAWARGNVRLQVYADPKHHHLDGYKLDQDQRFLASGLMIAVLSPPNKEGFGKRLHVQYDYDGPEKLSVEARRRIDPNFDPNKLPGPVKPDVAPPVPAPGVSAWVLIGQLFAALPGWSWILASLGVALLILRGAK